AGAREVFLIERPVAAAIGCGAPIFEARGSMVIDIGGGTVDMGIVSLGGIVDSKTIRFGGSDINNALLRYVRECFGVIVSEEIIEDIKHTVGTAMAPLEDAEYAFQGRDMMNGLGRRCVIHQSEVYQVVNDCIAGLLDEVKQMIRSAEPEIVADIMQYGIYLTGGTAQLSGLAERIGGELGVPVHVPDAPETKVVVGLNGASSDLVSLSRFIVNSKNRKGQD
ncbi:MAG: rod shape-determining protein, partial [Veillonella sp.]